MQTNQRKRKSLASYRTPTDEPSKQMLRKNSEQMLLKKLHEMFIC
jgi:hypothetical protein